MLNKAIIMTILVFALSHISFAKQINLIPPPGNYLTSGWNNGRYWKSLDLGNKINYLCGLEDGIMYFSGELKIVMSETKNDINSKIDNTLNKLTVRGFKFSELTKEIDKFYNDVANINVPIVDAYSLIIKKLKGLSSDNYEKEIINMRKIYNR